MANRVYLALDGGAVVELRARAARMGWSLSTYLAHIIEASLSGDEGAVAERIVRVRMTGSLTPKPVARHAVSAEEARAALEDEVAAPPPVAQAVAPPGAGKPVEFNIKPCSAHARILCASKTCKAERDGLTTD